MCNFLWVESLVCIPLKKLLSLAVWLKGEIFSSKRRAIAPGFLERDIFRLQTLQHVMKMTRTWDSTMSMIPKGGDTIWGGLDWSPEEGCGPRNKQTENDNNDSSTDSSDSRPKTSNFGRMISFGKEAAEAEASEIDRIDFRVTTKYFFLISCITFSLIFYTLLCHRMRSKATT